MSKDTHSESTENQLSGIDVEFYDDTIMDASDVAEEVAGTTRDAAGRATETAKEMYHSASLKAGDALATSKDYVRRNPVPVVLGAIAFGAAIGFMLMLTRHKPTFGERCVDDVAAARDAFLRALTPVTHGVHKGYNSARNGAGKAMDRVHGFVPGHGDSFTDQIGRIGNNLKFW